VALPPPSADQAPDQAAYEAAYEATYQAPHQATADHAAGDAASDDPSAAVEDRFSAAEPLPGAEQDTAEEHPSGEGLQRAGARGYFSAEFLGAREAAPDARAD
jgi:hypothetical protein